MTAWREGDSRELLVMCTGSKEAADFLMSTVQTIEGRALSDAEVRALAFGVRFGMMRRPTPPHQNLN